MENKNGVKSSKTGNLSTEDNGKDQVFNNFFSTVAFHIEKAFKYFNEKKGNITNADFISYGRTEEEKKMIAEACETIDKQYELLNEVRNSNLSLKEWLDDISRVILSDCSNDEVALIKQALDQEIQEEIEAQTEAFEDLADDLTTDEK